MKHDWSKFTLKINIHAPLKTIYEAWTVPQQLEDWFLRSAVFHTPYDTIREHGNEIQAGDTYEWYWHGHDDTVVEKGKVIEANGTDKLKFSFSGGALVTVNIGVAAGENIVMLTQEEIPTDEHGMVHYNVGCQTGWTFYLANLKSYLEGGIDLRNKNIAIASVVNS